MTLTLTTAQVRYRPTQFEMGLDLSVPNLTEVNDAFSGFTDSVKVGLAPTVELDGSFFEELTGIKGSVLFAAGDLWATRAGATMRDGRLTIPDFAMCHSGNMSITGAVSVGFTGWPEATGGYYLCPTVPNVPKCSFTPTCTESLSFLGRSVYTNTTSSSTGVGPTLSLTALVGLVAFVVGRH